MAVKGVADELFVSTAAEEAFAPVPVYMYLRGVEMDLAYMLCHACSVLLFTCLRSSPQKSRQQSSHGSRGTLLAILQDKRINT